MSLETRTNTGAKVEDRMAPGGRQVRRTLAAAGVLVALAMSGCGNDLAGAEVEEIREAATSAGLNCPVPQPIPNQKDTLNCGLINGSPTILYAHYEVDDFLLAMFKDSVAAGKMKPFSLLYGEDWAIQGDTDTLYRVHDELGGKIAAF